MSRSSPESKKFRTSREVVDRIRWDPALDESVFSLIYQERLSGDRTIPLSEFLQKDDFVWHRIHQICVGNLIVWDREKRIDLLLTSGDSAPENWKQVQEAMTGFRQNQPPKVQTLDKLELLPIYRYDTKIGKWHPSASPVRIAGTLPSKSLTIVSYNVLADHYQPDSIPTMERISALIQILKECEADIIALQEVTPLFLKYLLAEDWVMLHYSVSDGERAETVLPYGQLLLARIPFIRAFLYRFSEHKKVLFGIFGEDTKPILIATCHLASDHSQNAGTRRKMELKTLLQKLQEFATFHPEIESLIVGDFNTRGNELDEVREREGFQDVWEMLYPKEAGYTFDPSRNSLSALTTKSGLSGRFDRLWMQPFLKKRTALLDPIEITLLGTKSISASSTVFPSDHFGLYALFQRTSNDVKISEVSLEVQSALTLIPPESIWAPIQNIRKRYDPAYPRWMPHLNLIYPFVPVERFEESTEQIEDALAYFKPFEIRLTHFSRFNHSKSVTVWIAPEVDPPEALIQLHSILQRLFPQWQAVNPSPEKRFSPHLTVAKLSLNTTSEEEITALMKRWQEEWTLAYPRGFSFRVETLSLIHRHDQEPFEIKETVSLGEKLFLSEVGSRRLSEKGLALLARITQDVVGEPFSGSLGLYPIGSVRLGLEDIHSDLDVVFIGPRRLPRALFFEGVIQKFQNEGVISPTRRVVDALNPVLELEIEGKEIDLQYAEVPDSHLATAPSVWSQEMLKELDSASLSAVLGILDAEKLLEHIQKYGGLARFQEALKQLKQWTRYRGLVSQSFGFLGGFSWSLLLARVLKDVSTTASSSQILRHFFHGWAGANFQEPIALDSDLVPFEPVDRKDRWMVLLAPSAPWRNTTRYLMASTVQILKDEFCRVKQEWSKESDFEDYCRLARIEPSFPFYAEILLVAKSLEQRQEDTGKIQGHFLQFLLGLEKMFEGSTASSIKIRPYPYRVLSTLNDGFSCQWMVGINAEGSKSLNPILESRIKRLGNDFACSCLGEGHVSTLQVEILSSADSFFAYWKNDF